MASAKSLFYYYLDGSTVIDVNPDPPSKEEAKPYQVVVQDGDRTHAHIPISYLIFATDEVHARQRLEKALDTLANEAQVRLDKYGEAVSNNCSRAKDLCRWIVEGKYFVTVYLLDTDVICCKVNWASNGGL